MNVEYLDDGDIALYNGYKFRKDKKTGYYLSSRLIDGRRKRLHVYIWECEKGNIPEGYSIHHIDEDKSNNTISNYELMTNSRHTRLHGIENSFDNYNKMINNLYENAIPASKEWHSSLEGKKWHREHYESMKDKLNVAREFVCDNCGNKFLSKKYKSRFCTNKCKSAWRRKSGIDDIVKICTECGEEYIANKYQKTKYCSICKDKRHPRNWES